MTIDRSIGNYHDSSNARIRKIGRAVGPTAYLTGGDLLTASQIGLGQVEAIFFTPFTNGTVVISALYDPLTGKVKFFAAAGTETANATDLSTYSARFEAIGH